MLVPESGQCIILIQPPIPSYNKHYFIPKHMLIHYGCNLRICRMLAVLPLKVPEGNLNIREFVSISIHVRLGSHSNVFVRMYVKRYLSASNREVVTLFGSGRFYVVVHL